MLNELIDRFVMQDLPETGLEEISLQDFALGRPNQPKSYKILDENVFARLSNVAKNL